MRVIVCELLVVDLSPGFETSWSPKSIRACPQGRVRVERDFDYGWVIIICTLPRLVG